MKKPTMGDAERAADLLGVSTFTLAIQLRHAAADALEVVASRVRRDEDEPIDVGEARRLKWASDACLEAHDAVAAAKEDAA